MSGSKSPQKTQIIRTAEKPQLMDTRMLLGDQNEIRLVHRGEEYRLRVTRQGKLILTK